MIMRKALLILAVMFCALSVFAQDDYDYYKIDTIVIKSDDGALKIYYWDTHAGGTHPWHNGYYEYSTSSGKIVTTPVVEDFDQALNLYTIKKDDGSVYYIVEMYCRASSSDADSWLQAFAIKNDQLVRVSVLDGIGDPKKDGERFHVYHGIADWYYATDGEGWDWILEYDPKSKSLYIPTVVYDTSPPLFTDRYIVYRFDGQRFVEMGEQPHRGLHKSLANYKRLAWYFKTKNYTVRIDILDDAGTARYASWEKTTDMSQPPALVLIGGKKIEYYGFYDSYSFENHGYEYFVGYYQTIGSDGRPSYDDYLIVKKNGKILLKEKRL